MSPPHQIDGHHQLGRERGPVLGLNGPEIRLADLQPGQHGERDDPAERVRYQQAEDDPHVPVHEWAAGPGVGL